MHRTSSPAATGPANASSNIAAVGCDVIGKHALRLELAIELLARELDVILVTAVAENDEQRDDRDADGTRAFAGSMSDVESVTIATANGHGFLDAARPAGATTPSSRLIVPTTSWFTS